MLEEAGGKVAFYFRDIEYSVRFCVTLGMLSASVRPTDRSDILVTYFGHLQCHRSISNFYREHLIRLLRSIDTHMSRVSVIAIFNPIAISYASTEI